MNMRLFKGESKFMRLINADKISFRCAYNGNCMADEEKCKKCSNYVCDFESIQNMPTINDAKIMEREASHLGMTVTEMQKWRNLKENAKHAGAVVGITKNKQTDKAFDEAIEKLLIFEKEHGVQQ